MFIRLLACFIICIVNLTYACESGVPQTSEIVVCESQSIQPQVIECSEVIITNNK